MALPPATWPAEIISLFVDEVAKGPDDALQSVTLSACMLVSKAFYFPSRKYRFTNVEIPIFLYKKDVKSMAAFLDVIKANSTLLQFIRTFTLLFDPTYDLIRTQRNPSVEACFASKIAILSQIVEMVSRATIHTLSIKSKGNNSINLRRLGEEWHALLVALRCIPSVKTLYLQDTHDPPRAIIIGDPVKDNLEELHLYNINFAAHQDFHCPRRSGRTHPNFVRWKEVFEAACTTSLPPLSGLQVLRLQNVHFFYAFLRRAERITLLPPPTLPHLRSFSSHGVGGRHMIYAERDDIKFLDGVLPSLESLSLLKTSPERPFGFVRHQFDFSRFKNLRHLEISGWERDNTCLPALCSILSCPETPTAIESLSVTISRWVPTTSSHLDEHLALPEWSILDGILNNGHFPALRAISFTMNYTRPIVTDQTIPQEILQKAEHEVHISSLLPLLSTNQLISFNFKAGEERR